MWILHNYPNITRAEAYDLARREFYQLRLREDIERRIAKEEAESTGAYFGKSTLEVGMQLEDREYNRWLEYADQEVTKLTQARQASSGFVEAADDFSDLEGEEKQEALNGPSEESSASNGRAALGV